MPNNKTSAATASPPPARQVLDRSGPDKIVWEGDRLKLVAGETRGLWRIQHLENNVFPELAKRLKAAQTDQERERVVVQYTRGQVFYGNPLEIVLELYRQAIAEILRSGEILSDTAVTEAEMIIRYAAQQSWAFEVGYGPLIKFWEERGYTKIVRERRFRAGMALLRRLGYAQWLHVRLCGPNLSHNRSYVKLRMPDLRHPLLIVLCDYNLSSFRVSSSSC